MAAKLAQLREQAAQLEALHAEKKVLEEQVRVCDAAARLPRVARLLCCEHACCLLSWRACGCLLSWRACMLLAELAECAAATDARTFADGARRLSLLPVRARTCEQVAALRADVADVDVDALRAEHARLSGAAAEADRLAALNSELRLICVGLDELAAEQARLAPLAGRARELQAALPALRQQAAALGPLQVSKATGGCTAARRRQRCVRMLHAFVRQLLDTLLLLLPASLLPCAQPPAPRSSTTCCRSRHSSWRS